MEWTFLKKLISKLSQDVFRPAQGGLLYQTLQVVSREISGECPWDSGSECQRNFSTFYRGPKCRNITCPGYLHPTGLIAYTSRASVVGYGAASTIDNRFDFSSFRFGTSDDFIPAGTYGAEIKFDFGTTADYGGYGVGFYGAGLYGGNDIPVFGYHTVIGDKWKINCVAETGAVGPAVPISVAGSYGPIVTRGTYFGDFDTYYIVEITDFWGWQQNFEDALFQISLATATDEWVDYWGTYFGIPRLLLKGGYEVDSTYKARIMKEITRAKGTKPVIEEEARAYFGRDDISIIEYHQTYSSPTDITGFDKPVPLSPPNINWPAVGYRGANQPYPWPDPDPAWGLQPYQFYIFPPTQKVPSSKWIKNGGNLIEPDAWTGDLLQTNPNLPMYDPHGSGEPKVYVQESTLYTYTPPYGADPAGPVPNISIIDSNRNWLFITPAQTGDIVLFGCTKRFSGLRMVFSLPIVYDALPTPYIYNDGEVYNQLDGTGGGSSDGQYIWEYWNGTGWTLLTVTDGTVVGGPSTGSTILGGFGQDGWINWKLPGSDLSPKKYSLWSKANDILPNIPNVTDGLDRYWIRCRIDVAPTVVPDCNYVGFVYAGSTNRGYYNGTGVKSTLPIISVSVGDAGTGYNIGDVLILAGGTGGTVTVIGLTAGPNSGVFAVSLTTAGSRYGKGIKTTTSVPSSGRIGCTINVLDDTTPTEVTDATTYVTDKQPAADGFTYSVITIYKGDAVSIVSPYGKRDVNNIYIYSSNAWALPEWESGLQDIIDRLKTAGTVCIINPPT